MLNRPDITGATFGRLTAIHRSAVEAKWICSCACGGTAIVPLWNLTSGNTKSCGCVRRGRKKTRSAEYVRTHGIWRGMLARCMNPQNPSFARYGGRGIFVCERWQDFANFYADIGAAPEGLSLDRLDNDRGYEPGNCRWATLEVQANNKSTNFVVETHGARLTVAQWARRTGANKTTISARLKRGWPLADAVGAQTRNCE